MAGRVDINADLGELPDPAGSALDDAMLGLVTSASIACGGHAGDAASMRRVAHEAAARGVAIGAHVSYPDREHFGRRALPYSPDHLLTVLREQLDDLMAAAADEGTAVRYIKAHGALYNASVVNDAPAAVLLELAQDLGLPLLTQPDGRLGQCATSSGVEVYSEFFADRAYEASGLLRPRTEPGAVITDVDEIVCRVRMAVRQRQFISHDGAAVAIELHSICVHGDTPDAVLLATAVRDALLAEDVAVLSFVEP